MSRPAWMPSAAEVSAYVERAKSEGLICDRRLALQPRRDEYLRKARAEAAQRRAERAAKLAAMTPEERGQAAMVVSSAARERNRLGMQAARSAKRRAIDE